MVRQKHSKENGISKGMILISIMLSSLVLLLTIPNIYLDNQIYYKSRKLAQLKKVKIMLEEEQAIIKRRLEVINVKENFR
ncbi:MAG: Unknown protein [uncultured Sulfurovum sp.]|uniref:Uncharacterized protein n=1 Tax=uncultured Sulfurovum sp. TaxID=269237 RepID=A0A6S6TUM7_9BACT|nr:MAG: Unknown protein [uncultured Sulfurovum sp.]